MQKIELRGYGELEIHCPFCGKGIWTSDGVGICKHTLFHACDEGISFAHEVLGLGDEIELPDGYSMDQYTDELNCPEDTIKLSLQSSGPCFANVFMAFAPNRVHDKKLTNLIFLLFLSQYCIYIRYKSTKRRRYGYITGKEK